MTFENFLNALENGDIFVDIRIGVYNTGKNIGKTHDHGTGFRIKLDTLLKMLIDADQKTKSEIENRIVNMGEGIANLLVDRLQKVKGTQRGVIAMSLIRLGECSIAPLKRLALQSSEFKWIANYLISEI